MDALVHRWQRRMYAYARRLLVQEDKAWDACQEAWIGIVRGLRKLDDPGAFAGWAYRIVTNKCKDRLSQDTRAKWLSLELADNAHARQETTDPLELKEAIDLLPGHMQAALTLRYIEGFALGEIAEILGVPEGTIKSRLSRARAELKRILEK
jgi:RNA polymerase sigma-70 factor (ECF subfamily)